jgi:hypothetical protein
VASKPFDIIGALYAITLSPVSGSCHRVAGALLDHFNRKTGQCDPSVETLARLLNIDAKTVKTATAQLCAAGLFKKSSHGGYGHRASYTPQWHEFDRLKRDWAAKRKGKDSQSNGAETPPSEDDANGAETPPSTGRKHPFKGGENAPQTNISNQSNKPIRPSQASYTAADNVVAMRPEQPSHGLWRGSKRQSPSHSQVAREQAAKRWEIEIRTRCGSTEAYGRFLAWVDSEMSELATAAEMLRRGGGAQCLIERMHAAGMVVSDG